MDNNNLPENNNVINNDIAMNDVDNNFPSMLLTITSTPNFLSYPRPLLP
jgi:hypothetical protein